jgi:eukaryotic-like serine/threonine-protein kinase
VWALRSPDDDEAPTRPGSRAIGHEPTAPIDHESVPGEPPSQLLELGAIVAERYRIVRFIAHGGMGEVYEAHDQELGGQVALKTLRAPRDSSPDAARAWRAVERLRREIQLARRVTHPNVCRTFDVGRHRLPDGGDLVFLTMELLHGQTLLERIHAKQRLTVAEALPIAEAIAAGLRAAHQAGVIHRDLSSANVMLTGKRVVVTDFGLALESSPSEKATKERDALIVGSPAYMAPEQVSGDEVSVRTDVYAFGVVLYEMVTGQLPFRGETPFAVAMRRLQVDPAPPLDLEPTVPARWNQVILRCLARDPEARYASIDDLLAALREPPPRRAAWKTPLVAVVAGALAITAGVVALRWPRGTAAAGAPHGERAALAVLGFRNLSGHAEHAWLSTALGEQLGTELGAGGQLRLIPGESIARVKRDLEVTDAESYSPGTLARLRLNLDADYILVGSYLAASEGRLRIDLRLQNATTGETTAAVAEEGTTADLPGIVARAGRRLRTALALPAADADLRAVAPRSTSAARLYAEGLTALRGLDHPTARDRLAAAVAEDPNLAPAWAALGQAWQQLGYDGQARAATQRAFDLSPKLPREQRLLIEGQHREMSRELGRAVAIYRTLADLYPDDVDAGLRLAQALHGAGDRGGALTILAKLRALPGPAGADPRLDLTEAAVRSGLWDFHGVVRVAEHAQTAARERGARLFLAQALVVDATARLSLAEYERAEALALEGQAIFSAAGDQYGVARALTARAAALGYLGDRASAYRLTEEKLAIYRTLGNDALVAKTLAETAAEPEARGDFADAERRMQDALALYDRLEDPQARVVGRLHLAQMQIDRKNPATIAADLAPLVPTFVESGNKRMQAFSLAVLGGVVGQTGDLARAQRLFEEALSIQEILDLPPAVASTRLSLAELAVSGGDHATAERLAEQAVTTYGRAQHLDGESSARALLAYSRARLGRAPEVVLADANRALELAGRTDRIGARLSVTVWVARARGWAGDPEGALALLASADEDALRVGLVGTHLAAAITSAELRRDRAALTALSREARAAGFGELADRASRADLLPRPKEK